MLDELTVLIERTNQVIAQSHCRVNGTQPDGATRLLSLHEPDARLISKGRLGDPVEFGYKAQLMENTQGIIIDYSVHIGNPSDTILLRLRSNGSPTVPRPPPNWSPQIATTGTRPSKPT